MSAQTPLHGICPQHGLLDASDCGTCRALRNQCGLQDTEDHTKCGKADLSRSYRLSQAEYDTFLAWKAKQGMA